MLPRLPVEVEGGFCQRTASSSTWLGVGVGVGVGSRNLTLPLPLTPTLTLTLPLTSFMTEVPTRRWCCSAAASMALKSSWVLRPVFAETYTHCAHETSLSLDSTYARELR